MVSPSSQRRSPPAAARTAPRFSRRRPGAPRASQPEHEGAHRSERVTVDLPQVEGATCAAARAVHVEPWRAGNQRRTDRGRPKHLAPGGELFVPAVYNTLRFGTRGTVSGLLLGLEGNVEPARPDPHGGIIRPAVRQAKPEALALETLARQLLANEQRPQSRMIGRVASGYSQDARTRRFRCQVAPRPGRRRAEPERAGPCR